jgi:protein-S-isoprenylcysteine O-methyltransferase Ste14
VNRKRPLPPTYLLLGLVAMAASHFLFSGPRLISAPWRFLGVPAVLFGAWLSVRTDALFKTLGTEIKPFRASRLVVDEGPYRLSRHPMYLGFLAVLAGGAVLAGTLVPIIIFGVMVWLFTAHFVTPEERHMEEQFGEEYRAYKARVRRWF